MNPSLQLLLVEDSEDDETFIVHELRATGFAPQWRRVETEADFRDALRAKPEVILCDYTMPTFSVQRALAVLHECGEDLPFIIVSGSIGEDRAVESIRAGATDYVLKDRLERLGPVVKRALLEKRERGERQRAEAALRESEERFRQITENIQEVFWLADGLREHVLYVSPAYQTIWGRTCASLLESSGGWLASVHPDDHGRLAAAGARGPSPGEVAETYRILRPDGTVRWIHDRSFPIRDLAGKIYRMAGVAEDITGRKKLEAEFRQAQKMESIGQLAGGVAHDFNNLLTVINGNAGLLLAESGLSAEMQESIFQISDAAEQASGLTRQLLAFSRRETAQPRILDLNEVVAKMTKMLKRLLGEDVSLRTEFEAHPALVDADPGMIEQVLLNLAVNARDAMPDGGKLEIKTANSSFAMEPGEGSPAGSERSFVTLTMTDTGTGIPPEILPRIFEPFFTTKEPGKGTGLGLATVYGIVQQHGGRIAVENGHSVGTMFSVHLPAAAESASVAAAPSAPEIRGGDETILVVEDDPAVRKLARRILERFGYHVLQAEDGESGLTTWRAHRNEIKLVLTDLVMPGGMSGGDLVAKLRRELPSVKVIHTSGYDANLLGKNSSELDPAYFLPKPFEARSLSQMVRRVLDQPH